MIPGSGRSPGEENGNPLQYSCLENSVDGGAWWATVHGIAKSQTWLSNFTGSLDGAERQEACDWHSSPIERDSSLYQYYEKTPEANASQVVLVVKDPPAHPCRRYKRCEFHPWIGKIPWRRAWNPLQFSCLENPTDRGA